VRVERGRAKKLIVAFHFYRAEGGRAGLAGWDCEQCRRQGLETKRRCGFLPAEKRAPRKLVWVRGKTGAEECPKSLVTPASLELLEKFFLWRASGSGGLDSMTAREAEAMLILQGELRSQEPGAGKQNGE
jgi:hypothetical protein